MAGSATQRLYGSLVCASPLCCSVLASSPDRPPPPTTHGHSDHLDGAFSGPALAPDCAYDPSLWLEGWKASSHMWLLGTQKYITEGVNFKFYLMLIHLNFNSPMWLVATILVRAPLSSQAWGTRLGSCQAHSNHRE